MELVDGSGNKLNKEPKKIVDAGGAEVQSEQKAPSITTKDVGLNMATHLINSAQKNKTNEDVNKQLDVLYWAALNILSHRIVNVALGFGEEKKGILEWDSSRAFAQEKEVQDHLSQVALEWKDMFFNGELFFQPEKK
jgi:hypothetical protein